MASVLYHTSSLLPIWDWQVYCWYKTQLWAYRLLKIIYYIVGHEYNYYYPDFFTQTTKILKSQLGCECLLAFQHPLDMKKRLKQTIHSLCSPLNVPQQQNNSLGLPLSSMNKQRSLSNPLNVELCSTTAKELAQFTFQLYHYNLKLALYHSTSPHATLHAEIKRTYVQNFYWLLHNDQRILERNDEKE